MVAQEFFTLLSQFKITSYVGIEDFADKMNFLFSVMFFILSIMIVTIKSYFFKPLACYVATVPGGSGFDSYYENYCWVHGTIALLPTDKIPQNDVEWNMADRTKRITYYQWVPFILGLQCIMFYIPRIIWQLICYNKTGTDLESLISDANSASNSPPKDRVGAVEKVARTIEDMLFQHRDYRQGKVAEVRRKVYNMCNFCIFSKHLGTWLVISYLLMKVLYGINVIGQLFLMKHFLGFNESMSSFGYRILDNIAKGIEWQESGIFPRITYCHLGGIRHLGTTNQYVAQCALPINMLNEKIYIFLWFWVFIVGMITAVSIPIWFVRMAFVSNRSRFIKKFLIMKDTYNSSEKHLLNQFIKEFLRHDGVFILRMMFINAGDLITSDITCRLWEIYKSQYQNLDFRNFTFSKPLEMGTTVRRNPNETSSNDSMAKEPLTDFV